MHVQFWGSFLKGRIIQVNWMSPREGLLDARGMGWTATSNPPREESMLLNAGWRPPALGGSVYLLLESTKNKIKGRANSWWATHNWGYAEYVGTHPGQTHRPTLKDPLLHVHENDRKGAHCQGSPLKTHTNLWARCAGGRGTDTVRFSGGCKMLSYLSIST